MRLMNESQLLDAAFRKQVLSEIKATENVNRKALYLKRFEIYKDQTSKYVIQSLIKEGLMPETVAQMQNRAANISLCRKVVNKLARTYSGGVQRLADPASSQEQVDDMSRLLGQDLKMKKGDRYRELHRNCMFMVAPELDSGSSTDDDKRYKLKLSVLSPWQYDVIEDYYDREKARVVIISDFTEQFTAGAPATEKAAGTHSVRPVSSTFTNRKDDIIADAPADAGLGGKREFVWWSKGYHFTTDEAGEIVAAKSPEDLLNPIEYLPMINNADEQDGQFWARGGDDLIDGSILVNKLLTDMDFIAYLQGYGQFVVTGQNVTRERFKFGPNNAIVLEYDPSKEEERPQVDVISANPPIDSWMKMVEQYVALLLTTNNLSPSNVSGALSAATFPSGIAMLVEQSEATDDISDKQTEYKDIERALWEAIRRWQNLYFGLGVLSQDFAEIGALPEDLDISVKFHESKAVVTEAERLANIEKRKDLGINEMVELVMLDNPDMTREEAELKLTRIHAEKLKRTDQAMGTMLGAVPPEDEPVDEVEDDLAG